MLRVAVIGAEERTGEYARAFARTPGAELVAREPRLADALAAAVDAVVVATAPERHADQARAALRAGKHVLVDAPLATRVADADGMIAAATAAGRTLMVACPVLRDPAFEALAARTGAGSLGPLRTLTATHTGVPDDCVVWGLAPHDVSVFLHLVGAPPCSVTARAAGYADPSREDVLFATVRFADDTLAQLHVSRIDPRPGLRLDLVGARSTAELSDTAPTDEALPRQCRHFVHCVQTGERPDLSHALTVVRVLAAIQESVATDGTPVTI